jgi:hypothetical protein
MAPDRSAYCFMCLSHRETVMDLQLDELHDAAFRLSEIMAGIETIVTEQTGMTFDDSDGLRTERLRTEIKHGILKQRVEARRRPQRIPISDDLRAIVKRPDGWTESNTDDPPANPSP